MSQSKKKVPDSRSVEKATSSKVPDRGHKSRRTVFIIYSVVIALILIIIGVGFYQNYVTPFRRPIITVDDISINMDYFLERTRLAGADPSSMLTMLTNEQLIKLKAPQAPYNINISPEDIEQELRRAARGESETISESEFKEWYRQRLNATGLSDSEYREITRTALLAAGLSEYLTERMPTVAEQVHLHGILLATYEDAEKIRTRWEAGEDFADLAKEASLDEAYKENGGDLGWIPRGIIGSGYDRVIFSLSPGDVSEPMPYASDPEATEPDAYHLFMVSEKADAREIDEEYLPALKANTLNDWLGEEMAFHEIKWDFDSEINAWINWQLAKK